MNGPMRPLLVSLYGQKERHAYMQDVIISQQAKDLSQSKDRSYIATSREKKTELAVLDAHKREKAKIEAEYEEQAELYSSLKRKLGSDEEEVEITPNVATWLVNVPVFSFNNKM